MKRLAFALLLATSLGAVACVHSSKQTLAPTQRNPGSAGQVTAQEAKGGNTRLDVALTHLPDPAAFDANTYVVWIRPYGHEFINMGQVNIDQGRQGRLATLTPHQMFDVLVTAEDTATADRPSKIVMLHGNVDLTD